MSDTLRIVTFSAGGRPIVVRDLDDGATYTRARGSFKFTPGAPTPVMSRQQRRYGGARIVGVTHDNGQASWTAMVRGATPDLALRETERLIAEIESAARGRFLEWRPDGASAHLSSYLELAGPGAWDPNYQWVEFAGAMLLQVVLTWPTFPLVRWARETTLDPFDVDSISDYAFDALAAANTPIAGGVMTASGSLTSERRARHTARGYDHLDAQATVKATPGATIASFKAGVVLRGQANTYVEVYVDDNGTNSRLRIDVILAGVRTNRQTNNLAARVVNGTPFWVRGRIEGETVTAEYFLAAATPTPMGTPTLAPAGYTLTGPETAALVAGDGGFSWVPQTAAATLDDLAIEPRVFRNKTLPQTLSLRDVPGTAPAQLCLAVTPSGGSAAPAWALVGWAPTPAAGAPFGIIEAESAGDLSGWVVSADANARGGSSLSDAVVAGAETYTASWTVNPSLLVADDFTDGEISVEVWARVAPDNTLVSPKLTVSIRPLDGLNFGAERFSDDYGSAGKLLVVPTGDAWRPVRLGTLTFPVDPLRPRQMKLWLAGSTAAGSSGFFGLDYLWLVPARARAASPSAKPLDAAFPKFVASTSQTTKLIRSDLSGGVSLPPANPHPDHGLGGSLLELPPGDVDLLVKLSSLVPDDPTVNASSEQLAHSATVQAMVTPRSFMLRSA